MTPSLIAKIYSSLLYIVKYIQLLCLAGDVMNISNMDAALPSQTKVPTLGPTSSQPSLPFSFFQFVSFQTLPYGNFSLICGIICTIVDY